MVNRVFLNLTASLLLKSVFLVCGVLLSACAEMGARYSEQESIRFSQSKNYHSEKQVFVNQRKNILEEMYKRIYSWKTIEQELFSGAEDLQPERELVVEALNIEAFFKDDGKAKFVWLGHSSVLIRINNVTILVDPVFSENASPFPGFAKRFQNPVVNLSTFPRIDAVLISHDHYDHLDMESIEYLSAITDQFLVPLGVAAHLKYWGVNDKQIQEFDWWQALNVSDVKFVFTPSQHTSGRGLFDHGKTLWGSWVIQHENHSLFFSGDSGYGPHFKQIGDAYGPFDIAFIESGQYNRQWREVHLQPKEWKLAYEDLKAKYYYPVHWGVFSLSSHAWYQPVEYLERNAAQINVFTSLMGEVVALDALNINANNCWQRFIALAHANCE
mgnify:CR=1 FL=1